MSDQIAVKSLARALAKQYALGSIEAKEKDASWVNFNRRTNVEKAEQMAQGEAFVSGFIPVAESLRNEAAISLRAEGL